MRKAHRWCRGITLLITSALDGGEWSISYPSCFLTGTDPSAHWKGGSVGPRACLDNIVKRKILTLADIEPWIVKPVALPLNWLLYLSFTKQQLLEKNRHTVLCLPVESSCCEIHQTNLRLGVRGKGTPCSILTKLEVQLFTFWESMRAWRRDTSV